MIDKGSHLRIEYDGNLETLCLMHANIRGQARYTKNPSMQLLEQTVTIFPSLSQDANIRQMDFGRIETSTIACS
jgi:hypothetical protein